MASKRVTVFGGSGFLGRQIVKSLAAEGTTVRVAVRYPERASFIERLGRNGQIELVRANIWDESTVARAVKLASATTPCQDRQHRLIHIYHDLQPPVPGRGRCLLASLLARTTHSAIAICPLEILAYPMVTRLKVRSGYASVFRSENRWHLNG